jgi:tetratricopeptide (TPR) repeat protein
MKWVASVCMVLGMWGIANAESAGSSFEKASQKRAAGEYLVSLEYYESAMDKDPNNLKYGNDYRQAVVQINEVETYERCISFFENLTRRNGKMPNAWLNYGYAYVDKIPVEGAITQVLLANTALGYFGTALTLEHTWLGHFTRGNSYLYWPAIFGRTALAITDLEMAIAISEKEKKQRLFHVRPYVGLGEAYWRLDNIAKAREIWKGALERFPGNADLIQRLAMNEEALTAFLTTHFEPGKRVNTDLSILWEGEGK